MPFIALTDVAHIVSAIDEEKARDRFGGKAVNLGILLHKGFPVPEGFVITTSEFEAVMREAIRANPDESPQALLKNYRFSREFEESLQSAMDDCDASCWAVRSSSSDEDSRAHSFAGLQQSVIGVRTRDELLEAIRTVWMSFYARERLLYPMQASPSAVVPSMAVIVQKYVDSHVAGVVFTRHPIDGERSLLINVSKGQGSNVVDGKSGESLSLEKNTKTERIASECLTETELDELIQRSCDIETAYGKPQDIEFAFAQHRLYILQTRDIAPSEHDASQILYSNVNVGEALSGVCTPMTWSVGLSIAKQGFQTIFAMLGMCVPPHYDFVTTFHGHIYLNISQFLSMASQVPFVDPAIFAKIVGIKSLREYACAITPLSRTHFIQHLPHSMRELLKMQARMRHLPKKAIEFEKKRDELLKIDLRKASCPQIRDAFRRLHDLFLECAIDMLAAGGAFLASYLLCASFIGHFSENETHELEQSLFSGLLDLQCAAPGLELLEMARQIQRHPALTKAFIDEENFNDFDAFKRKIIDLPGYAEFSTQFARFIAAYGARATQEAELANPRWREDPSFLFKVIRMHIKSSAQTHAKDITEHVSNHRQARTLEFKSMLSYTLRPIFRALLDWTQKNARLREVWRAYIVDVLGIFRKYFLEVASQLVELGILGRREDIFFLTYDEFNAYLENPEMLDSARQRVTFRRARHEAFMSAHPLPDTFLTHPNNCGESPDTPEANALYGLPASPGCVQARVRVIHSLEEADALEYGEILVTTTTDVGWTPLFLMTSAILTERGGPLSHAFVVAREYGVPAVVSIPGLLEKLKTGDLVRVSGEKGSVVILDSDD